MKKSRNITAIILAGGKSSRMGTDKGFVSYKNKPFVQRIIEVIRPLVNEIIIISNNPNYDIFGIKRFNDLVENAGPLAGIQTGLYESETENNLVISCDVPLISSEVIEKLIEQISEDVDIIQLQSKGREMPLIAIYKKQCEHIILKELNRGERRVREVLKQCSVKTIILEKELEIFTTNINTPTDLKNVL